MPSNWQAVDSNFPSFTGDESPTQQIRALHNYLYCLKEQLQYSLQNLTSENWNVSALNSLTEDTKNALAGQLSAISSQVSQLKVQVETLQGRVTDVGDLGGRVTALEEDETYLEQRMDAADEAITSLQNTASDHEQRITTQETAVEELTEQADRTETAVAAMDDELAALTQTVSELDAAVKSVQTVIQSAEDGSSTIGQEGGKLYLVGEVYVNGVLLEQGGTNETT